MAWVARAKSNRDIGDILGLSARTVENHVMRACRKLGVESRIAALGRLGWINAPKDI